MSQHEKNRPVLESIARRAHYFANQMIYMANTRDDVGLGDPKVGGHSSASSSALHILGAIHLIAKSGYDMIANKPHASPADHSYNYLLEQLFEQDGQPMSEERAKVALTRLRAYPKQGEAVFQSYHSALDADGYQFFPSGTVGIPPVNAGYMALAYRFAKDHGYEVPPAHFWAVIGDSEFREGSLFEAVPDFAEREIGNLTWIVDYNRQSLDGHRITNKKIMDGTDDHRIERTMRANGWEVIQVRHGSLRKKLFAQAGGAAYQKFLEEELEDYELQALLLVRDMRALKIGLAQHHPQLKKFLESVSDADLFQSLRDLGGHDIIAMAEALLESKKNTRRPSLIVAHTVKGWGLQMAAAPGNHSSLPDESEIQALRDTQGVPASDPFQKFGENSKESLFLKKRGESLEADRRLWLALREKNRAYFARRMAESGTPGITLDINLKMANFPHTQWMLGQLTAKLSRLADTPLEESKLKDKQKALTPVEKSWKLAGELMVHMAPDVGTSTNLNPAMDGKIFGAPVVMDIESELGVKDRKTPDLVPGEEVNDRFLRFEIAEGNVMSCVGSFGRMRDQIGVPFIPLMTVYDFFVKRALDQFFYNLYWKSSFILVGTPSGVTLSPEGAQHGWKSDIQIPQQITWEPAFCVELDWIMSDAIRRHLTYDNEGRTGVFIRGVTRGLDQKLLLASLKTQVRFKSPARLEGPLHPSAYPMAGAIDESSVETIEESAIMNLLREDVLSGGYWLLDFTGYAGYEPGDNVVHIFCMGSLVTEAIEASRRLLRKGIYANVFVVTCVDLLNGNLGHANNYSFLRSKGITGDLYLKHVTNGHVESADWVTVAGRRIPIVSVHDGEPGLLDNLGSIVGVRHETLACRKHSKCGRPVDVYHYHGIDADAVVEACGKVLSETALEATNVDRKLLGPLNDERPASDWRQLWPMSDEH
jgi:pyruvate dehydrogenase E1 component